MDRTRNDELLTIKEAASLLKMSTVTVRRWLKQGRLTGYRVGARSIRLRRRDIEALLEPTENEVTDARELPPLTDEEVARLEETGRRSDALSERIYRERNGGSIESSVDLIRENREHDAYVYDVPPLTDEELARRTEAIRRADELRAEMRRKRGGKPMPSSVDLIRAERNRRSYMPDWSPVSEERLARRGRAIQLLRELRAEMSRRNDGKPMASSVDMIREDRERDS